MGHCGGNRNIAIIGVATDVAGANAHLAIWGDLVVDAVLLKVIQNADRLLIELKFLYYRQALFFTICDGIGFDFVMSIVHDIKFHSIMTPRLYNGNSIT